MYLYSVCLDLGHGGYDPGAVGNGLREKDITLKIGNALAPLLVRNGIAVCMTRTGDYAPGHLENRLNDELKQRVKISDSYPAKLFVAIHVNAGGGTGEEVLVCATGGNAEKAAKMMLNRVCAATGFYNRGIKVQHDYVLVNTDCPAILTENGFIDNPSDATKLKSSDFINKIVTAHAMAICDYFGLTFK